VGGRLLEGDSAVIFLVVESVPKLADIPIKKLSNMNGYHIS
jgi:hypothetical protein